MKKWFGYGGIAASIVLIAFGIASIAVGFSGRSEVRDRLAEQKITATPDAAEITNGKLQPGALVDTGIEAKRFADIMEFHALEATGGSYYAEMGRYLTPEGKETSDEAAAAKDENGRPVPNRARDIWVTQTALATALNTSFFAERVAMFSIVMGVALLLTGIGFLVLTLGGALGVVLVHRRQPRLETSAAT